MNRIPERRKEMAERIFVKTAACICGLFSLIGIFTILSLRILNSALNPLSELIFDLIYPACFAAIFITSDRLSDAFTSPSLRRTAYISVSALILLYGILKTPYSPCNDPFEMHEAMSYLLSGKGLSIYTRSYMDFWINNKLTAYCYYPLVRLFGNITLGIRVMNAILLAGFVFFTSGAVHLISGKKNGETAMLIISALSPFMLLTGPYIYLPSIFLSSAAVFCLSLRKKTGLVFFFICSSLLFVLRPTGLGFILVYIIADAFFSISDKKYFLKRLVCAALVIVFGVLMKLGMGQMLYALGAHRYPAMQSSALLWTLELGTRPNGEETGSCSYTPIDIGSEPDDIKRDFNKLWVYYQVDETFDCNHYEEIKAVQKDVRQKLIERLTSMKPAQFMENILNKTAYFFGDVFIPYYYKANVNDKNLDMAKNYDEKYFAYQNSVLLLFFITLVVNILKILLHRDSENSKQIIAFGLGAVAVNMMLLLFTEVSKKYMFDFIVPVTICTALTFTVPVKKSIRPRRGAKILAAAIFLFAMRERAGDIRIFDNAQTRLAESDGNCTFTITMNERYIGNDYSIQTYQGNLINLNGQDEVTLEFPKNCSDAFELNMPDGRTKAFSAQILK